jgi:predicted transport protein
LKVSGAEGYSVAGHLAKVKDEGARQAFESLRSYMLNLDTRVIETPKKWFIGYSMGKKFAEIVPQAKAFLLYLNLHRADIDSASPQVQMDAVQLGIEDVSNLGRWATGNMRVKITNKDQAEQAQSLVEYSFMLNSRLRTSYDQPK